MFVRYLGILTLALVVASCGPKKPAQPPTSCTQQPRVGYGPEFDVMPTTIADSDPVRCFIDSNGHVCFVFVSKAKIPPEYPNAGAPYWISQLCRNAEIGAQAWRGCDYWGWATSGSKECDFVGLWRYDGMVSWSSCPYLNDNPNWACTGTQ